MIFQNSCRHGFGQWRRASAGVAAAALMLVLSACGPGSAPTSSAAGASSTSAGAAQPTTVQTATGQAVAVAETSQFQPSVTIDPPAGHAGIYVRVRGEGWPPNMMVVVTLTDPGGISMTVASKDTDTGGNLMTGFLYPIDARWLLDTPYSVVAQSADGKHQASAQFQVVEPGAAVTPATGVVATVAAPPTVAQPVAVPTNAPIAVATVSIATPTPAPQPTATAAQVAAARPTATPQPTAQPTVQPTAQAQSVETASTGDQSPEITVALVREEGRRGSRQQVRVEVVDRNPANALREITAFLVIPPLAQTNFDDVFDDVGKIKLRVRENIDIKMDRGKLEISGPDPEALLASIREVGGIPVSHGQVVEYKSSPEHRYRLRADDGVLEIDASTLLLKVIAVDAAGKSHEITVAYPAVSGDNDDDGGNSNRRDRDEGDEGDDRDGDHGKNKDDDGKNKNGNKNNRGRGRGNDHPGRGNRD